MFRVLTWILAIIIVVSALGCETRLAPIPVKEQLEELERHTEKTPEPLGPFLDDINYNQFGGPHQFRVGETMAYKNYLPAYWPTFMTDKLQGVRISKANTISELRVSFVISSNGKKIVKKLPTNGEKLILTQAQLGKETIYTTAQLGSDPDDLKAMVEADSVRTCEEITDTNVKYVRKEKYRRTRLEIVRIEEFPCVWIFFESYSEKEMREQGLLQPSRGMKWL